MKLVIIVLLMFYSPSLTPSSGVIGDEQDVEIVIETFFEGMRESNGDKINSVIYSDMTLQTVVNREGKLENIFDCGYTPERGLYLK